MAQAPNLQGRLSMELAKVLDAANQSHEAAEAARQALAFYERKGNVPAAMSARAFIGDLRG